MAKVLVIRKTDKTIHKVPLENKAALMAYSNRLPAGQKWSFEEMDEKEADKLPFIDDSYVAAADAVSKVKTLEGELNEKDEKIKELLAQLAEKESGAGKVNEKDEKIKELPKDAAKTTDAKDAVKK